MKNIALVLFALLSGFANAQSDTQLSNQENQIIILLASSSKCEIFYGNGNGEDVRADIKKAKSLDLDAEERNLAMVINKILNSGWKLHEIRGSSGSQYQSAKPSHYYFTRKE